MSFKFGLFRVLSSVNLMLFGSFCLLGIMGFLGTMQLAALVPLIFPGAVAIHSWLSLALARSISDPATVLKESAPGGIRIMGAMSTLLAFILLCLSLYMFVIPDDLLKEALRQQPETSKIGTLKDWKNIFSVCAPVFLFMGLSVTINYILSLHFLHTWKFRQAALQEKEVEELF